MPQLRPMRRKQIGAADLIPGAHERLREQPWIDANFENTTPGVQWYGRQQHGETVAVQTKIVALAIRWNGRFNIGKDAVDAMSNNHMRDCITTPPAPLQHPSSLQLQILLNNCHAEPISRDIEGQHAVTVQCFKDDAPLR